MNRWDIILVGAGLANGLIAWRLRQCRPELRVLMLETGSRLGGNHTWSFHQDDLTREQHQWIAPLVAHRWDGYDIIFPQFTRTLRGRYLSVTAERFAAAIGQRLGKNVLTDSQVIRLAPRRVQLADGQILSARAVIDGRGYQPSSFFTVASQAFVGQQWQLARPHGLTRPILMDATVDQPAGYRFVYTLPLSPTVLLIEDTQYIDGADLDVDTARQRIADYAGDKGWQLMTLRREEQGRLPITLTGRIGAFWQHFDGQPCSGIRAGLFHPATGYSLPLAARLADHIASQPRLDHPALFSLIHTFAVGQWQQQRFFRLLNRMLFLAGSPTQRWRVMQHFYRLDDRLIARFYAGHPTLADRARILLGKPPVPVGEALRAMLKCTPRLRAFYE